MNDWVIAATFALPHQPLDKHIDLLADRFDELDWSVTRGLDARVTIVGYRDGDDPVVAVQYVLQIAREALQAVGLPGAETVRIDVSTEEERERRARTPVIPDLVAASDVGRMLGVSRQRVHQLHRDSDEFPEPVVKTGAGPLWTAAAIEWFDKHWSRRPGRPAYRGVAAAGSSENVRHLHARPADATARAGAPDRCP